MGGKASKDKGKSFERDVCKILIATYNENFERVIGSGAFVGGKNIFRQDKLTENQLMSHKGDIVPPDDWRYFNCECKSYKDFPFHQLFNQQSIGLLETWIAQTMIVSSEQDCNFIIMKFDRKGRYILVEKRERFKFTQSVQYIDKDGRAWMFGGLEDFLALNKAKFRKRCILNT